MRGFLTGETVAPCPGTERGTTDEGEEDKQDEDDGGDPPEVSPFRLVAVALHLETDPVDLGFEVVLPRGPVRLFGSEGTPGGG